MADPRPVVRGSLKATITVAGHTVAAGCEVVLLDDNGYEGRLCLWGVQERTFSDAELALMACPIVSSLGHELGDDQVVGIDIWFMRADTTHRVTAEAARGQTIELNTLVSRLTNAA